MGAARHMDNAMRVVIADEAWRERADRLQASLEAGKKRLAEMEVETAFWRGFVQRWETAGLSECIAMSREAFPHIEQEQAQ